MTTEPEPSPGQTLLTHMGWDYLNTESAARRVAEVAENLLQEKNERCVELDNHARFTVSTLEKFLKNRGWTTGLKKWEQELLVSAYQAMKMPEKDWKFGLAEKKKILGVKTPKTPKNSSRFILTSVKTVVY